MSAAPRLRECPSLVSLQTSPLMSNDAGACREPYVVSVTSKGRTSASSFAVRAEISSSCRFLRRNLSPSVSMSLSHSLLQGRGPHRRRQARSRLSAWRWPILSVTVSTKLCFSRREHHWQHVRLIEED